MKLIDILNTAVAKLAENNVETSRLDAEVLLAHALGIERIELYINKSMVLDEKKVTLFNSFIKQRADGCPVAYITGIKEFWSIPMKVTKDALIPRPETELVVERALEIIGDKTRRLDILDLGTGSGCIATALAKELPNASFVLTDVSEEALSVARMNIEFAKDRAKIYCGSLFDPVAQKFDIIVSNPPYIPTGHRGLLCREITEHEPEVSLYGGKSGLDFIAKIIEDALLYLNPNGYLIMEMGLGQADKLRTIAEECGGYSEVIISKDLAGIERAISLKNG